MRNFKREDGVAGRAFVRRNAFRLRPTRVDEHWRLATTHASMAVKHDN
jgi:hypothetical protein